MPTALLTCSEETDGKDARILQYHQLKKHLPVPCTVKQLLFYLTILKKYIFNKPKEIAVKGQCCMTYSDSNLPHPHFLGKCSAKQRYA
jgi:hypothetical protein